MRIPETLKPWDLGTCISEAAHAGGNSKKAWHPEPLQGLKTPLTIKPLIEALSSKDPMRNNKALTALTRSLLLMMLCAGKPATTERPVCISTDFTIRVWTDYVDCFELRTWSQVGFGHDSQCRKFGFGLLVYVFYAGCSASGYPGKKSTSPLQEDRP